MAVESILKAKGKKQAGDDRDWAPVLPISIGSDEDRREKHIDGEERVNRYLKAE